MLKIDALIDLFFTDLPFAERAARIAECGYKYIETWRGGDAAELKSMTGSGVELVSIVLTNNAVAPVRAECLDAFLQRIDEYSDNALSAGCKSGIVTAGNLVPEMSAEEHKANLIEALRRAGELCAPKGFRLNLEPLNTLVDHAGHYLESRQDALEVVKTVALDNVKMLYDIYHMEIMHGNQSAFISENLEYIGHFHSAGVPGRHELFNGETNYPFIAKMLDNSSYQGYFGLEYFPELESGESLRKTLAYLNSR
jgi:hydroxypyruvate isomerase